MNIDIRKPIDSDDDSMSTDSSSNSEDDANEELLKEAHKNVKVFKEQIVANHLDYDAHIGLIKSLRQLGDFDCMRNARQEMNKYYPLSPDLWMEWLKDEEKICATDEERKFVISLFEKAILEYMSVNVWVEYVMFTLSSGDIKETRSICDQALIAVGIHVAEGELIWQAVNLVEQQVLYNLQVTGDEEKIIEQKKRLQSLIRRQARVPLLNMDKESFLKEASTWFDGELDPAIESDLEKSLDTLKGKIQFENRLIKAEGETEKLEAYRIYIDYVIKHDTPAAVQNIYERTITDLCLNATLWEEYVRFVMDQFKFSDYVVLPVCERSQRNCPWSGVLCELHITAIQRFSNILSPSDVSLKARISLENMINSGTTDKDELMQAWMSYLVFLRRNLDLKSADLDLKSADLGPKLSEFYEQCEKADRCLAECSDGDLFCEILRFKVRIGLLVSLDIEQCRKVWNEYVMKRNNNFKNMDLWLEFIRAERQFGDEIHTRKLFRRALEYAWDDVEEIGKAFRSFEQEVGTLETMEEFNRRYKDRLAIVNQRRSVEGRIERNKVVKNNKFGKEKTFCKERDKSKPLVHSGAKHVAPQKKGQMMTAMPKNINKFSKLEIKGEHYDIEPPPGYKRPSDDDIGNSAKKFKKEADVKHGEFVKHDHSKDYRSVFLSNLDFTTTVPQIEPIFTNCGEKEELRLVRDYQGRSKGFGYLIFKESSAVMEALKLDRTPIGSRPMFVSKCSVSQREKVFKFSVGEEKNKLFVRGLPLSMNEEQIKKEFEAHGEIKSIRLATLRNGCFKGVCYIEFANEKIAEYVRQEMDQKELIGKTITVLISNPSVVQKNSQKNSSDKMSPPVPSLTARPKMALSLVPRALLGKKLPVNPKKQANGTVENSPSSSSLGNVKSMSNEDFRSMLLKK